jgi:GNAT superfamily N-acetyltransferase
MQIRPVRTDDSTGMARAWLDAGRYYAALDPVTFQVPSGDGLVESFTTDIRTLGDDDLCLVADVGEVAGFVRAVLQPPQADARHELMREFAHPRAYVQILVVAEAHRRAGAGTALMSATEGWARDRGAVAVNLNTNLRSPLSVPFYERLGYMRRGIAFHKSLAG